MVKVRFIVIIVIVTHYIPFHLVSDSVSGFKLGRD